MVNITKVESLIKENGWSNSYFCSILHKNRGWIRDWKHGIGLPDENTLQTVADKLNTTIDYLTDKTDIKNKPSAEAEGFSEESKKLLKMIEQLNPANRAKLEELCHLFLADQDKKK